MDWNETGDREEAPNYGRQKAGDGKVVMRIGVTRW
jgi:hypothetical protein